MFQAISFFEMFGPPVGDFFIPVMGRRHFITGKGQQKSGGVSVQFLKLKTDSNSGNMLH